MIDAPEIGREFSFEEKLLKQMTGASPGEWGILCDVYYVYCLPSTNITIDKIRHDIGWASSQAGLPPPPENYPIWQAQTHGFTRTAIKYHIKYCQFWLIILFALHVKSQASSESIVSNHTAMRGVMDTVLESIEVRSDRAYDMRHALLYMAYPDYYERIISTQDKQWIVNTYRDRAGGTLPEDHDDAILLIRTKLGKTHDKLDRKFDFYTDLKDEWKPGGTAPAATVTVDTDKGVVTVPDGEIEREPLTETVREHTVHKEIQWLLLKLGNDMGLDLWVATNDRGKEINAQKLGDIPRLKLALPLTFDEAINKTIQLIDVIWLKQNSILASFEIEITTSIYSGILRMADLIAMQPNIKIPLYIVAPDERRNKVYAEVNRPVFTNLPTPTTDLQVHRLFDPDLRRKKRGRHGQIHAAGVPG